MKKIYFIILSVLLSTGLNAQTMSGWITNPGFETLDASTSTGAADWELVLINGAQATATVVTAAEAGLGSVPEGSYAIKVVVTTLGTNNHTDIKLVNTVYNFTDYYTIPDNGKGQFTCTFTWDQHAIASPANADQTQIRIVYNQNGGDIATNSASVSQGKWNTAEEWQSFSITKTNRDTKPISPTALSLRQDIALGYETGTFYIDNLAASVDGAVAIPTSIGQLKESDIKIWSANRTINIVNMLGQPGLATVYDLSGRQIKQVQLSANENTIEIPKSGLYIVKSTIEGNVLTQKVVVK